MLITTLQHAYILKQPMLLAHYHKWGSLMKYFYWETNVSRPLVD